MVIIVCFCVSVSVFFFAGGGFGGGFPAISQTHYPMEAIDMEVLLPGVCLPLLPIHRRTEAVFSFSNLAPLFPISLSSYTTCASLFHRPPPALYFSPPPPVLNLTPDFFFLNALPTKSSRNFLVPGTSFQGTERFFQLFVVCDSTAVSTPAKFRPISLLMMIKTTAVFFFLRTTIQKRP